MVFPVLFPLFIFCFVNIYFTIYFSIAVFVREDSKPTSVNLDRLPRVICPLNTPQDAQNFVAQTLDKMVDVKVRVVVVDEVLVSLLAKKVDSLWVNAKLLLA